MSSTFPLPEVPILEEVAHQLSQQKVGQQLSEVSKSHAELQQAKCIEKKTSAPLRPDCNITAEDIKATTKELQKMDATKMPEDVTQKDERDNEEHHPVKETTPATDPDPAYAGLEETPHIPSKGQTSVQASTAVRSETPPRPSKRARY